MVKIKACIFNIFRYIDALLLTLAVFVQKFLALINIGSFQFLGQFSWIKTRGRLDPCCGI